MVIYKHLPKLSILFVKLIFWLIVKLICSKAKICSLFSMIALEILGENVKMVKKKVNLHDEDILE